MRCGDGSWTNVNQHGDRFEPGVLVRPLELVDLWSQPHVEGNDVVGHMPTDNVGIVLAVASGHGNHAHAFVLNNLKMGWVWIKYLAVLQ